MPIKAVVASLDGLADPIKGLYTQVTDEKHPLKGKYLLGVEAADGFELDNVQSLKSALGTERGEHEKAKNLLKSFDGLDPAKFRDQLKELETLKAIDPTKEADKLAQAKFASLQEQLKSKHGEELGAAKTRADKLLEKVKDLSIKSVATAAIAKHKGIPEGLMPFVERSVRLEEDANGNFITKVVDAQGNPRIKNSAGDAMGIEDLVLEFKSHDVFGRFFEGTGKGGSGSSDSKGTPGAKTMTRAAFEALTPGEKANAMASGTTLTD